MIVNDKLEAWMLIRSLVGGADLFRDREATASNGVPTYYTASEDDGAVYRVIERERKLEVVMRDGTDFDIHIDPDPDDLVSDEISKLNDQIDRKDELIRRQECELDELRARDPITDMLELIDKTITGRDWRYARDAMSTIIRIYKSYRIS